MEATVSAPQPISAKHPPGLYVLFLTEMWERFSYYGMRAILLLFLIDNVRGGMGLSEMEGAAIYGLYTASAYLLALPGGWIADNILGQRKSIWYGGFVIMFGHILLAIPAGNALFFIGLITVALGTGLLKPNISSIVGELYPEGGARRDAAFSIFYMGINMGSFLGITVVGYLGQKVGWHYGFGAAAVGMLFGLIVFRILGQKYLSNYGNVPTKTEKATEGGTQNRSLFFLIGLIALLIFMQFTGVLDLTTAQGLAKGAGIIITLTAVGYFLFILLLGGLTLVEKKRVGVLFVFFAASAIFWAGFEQQGSSFQIFSDRYTDLNVFGWQIPSSWFQNFNPAFILIFSPVLAALWIFLGKRNLNPPPHLKFAVALLLLGLGYLVMVVASKIALTGELTSPLFLTFTYLFHTLGELCLSPVGLSSFTKLAPKRYVSQLMGVWFVGTSLGNLIAGLFAGGFDESNVHQMPELFMSVVYFSFGFAILILIFSKPLKSWLGGVK
ncbi:peptide MFS transporter [Larkinella terrae]|uniref:MFS transporter n=1 Tax=Larkinella terrae TaxID=2025311 RepID=A0A7K0ELD1_9BACT|nr:peptide MFS transporter [Larkinella terrae]MRS62351.1 MFS transporter [Larkinella terrae]